MYNKRNYTKEPNRNTEAKNYNKRNEKFTTEIQQQAQIGRRKN